MRQNLKVVNKCNSNMDSIGLYIPIFEICTGTVVDTGKVMKDIHKGIIIFFSFFLSERFQVSIGIVLIDNNRRHVYLWRGGGGRRLKPSNL